LSRTAECNCGSKMASGAVFRKSLRSIGESPGEGCPLHRVMIHSLLDMKEG
jgi:hypothetical protein